MYIEKADFDTVLANALTPIDLSKYFDKDCEWLGWDDHDEDDALIRAAERAIELVSTVEDGIALFNAFGNVTGVVTAEQDTCLFSKIVALAKTSEDLNSIYYSYVALFIDDDIKCRNHIRLIFDKADGLGLEASATIRN